MRTAGVRGAITVERDEPEAILQATQEMLSAILANNPDIQPEDIASALFTVTPDLCSVFPAKAARQMGWSQVPLMCAQEIPVTGALPRCIRVLLHWNTEHTQSEIQHVYLREAIRLRPDLNHENTDRK